MVEEVLADNFSRIPEDQFVTPEDLRRLGGSARAVAPQKTAIQRPEFSLPEIMQPVPVQAPRIDLMSSSIADHGRRAQEVISSASVVGNDLQLQIKSVNDQIARIDTMENSLRILTDRTPDITQAVLEQSVREEAATWEAREQVIRAENRALEQRQRMVERNVSAALAADPDAEVESLENQSAALKQQIAGNLARIKNLSTERVKAQDVSSRQLEQFRAAVAWGQEELGQVLNAGELMEALRLQRSRLQNIVTATEQMQEKLKKTRQVEGQKNAIDGLAVRFEQMNTSGLERTAGLVDSRRVVEQALSVLQGKYDTERAGANRGKSLARIRKEMNRLQRTVTGMNATIGQRSVEPNIMNNYMANERLLQEAESVLQAARQTAQAVREQIEYKVRTDNDQDSVGGITMSDKYLTINVKVDGAGMPLPVSMQDAAMVNIDGLSPVIHQIVPVTSQNIPVLADLMRSGV